MSATVIYDDRDDAVEYFPSWRTKGLGRVIEFQSTTSNPGKHGNTAVFHFSGTSVSVFGTVGAGEGSSMSFQVDDEAPVEYPVAASTTTTHHQLLFSTSTLSETSPHSLTMVSTGPDVSQIFLDYFLVQTPDAAATRKPIFVDDNDSDAAIQYSTTGWSTLSSEEYFQLSAHAGEPGSWVQLTFEGTQVSLHGPIMMPSTGTGVAPLTGAASIDGGPPIPLSAPRNLAAGTTTLNNLLFTSPLLPLAKHTLNISVSSASEGPLFIDYFLVNSSEDDVQASKSDNGNDNTAQKFNAAPSSVSLSSSSVPAQAVEVTAAAESPSAPAPPTQLTQANNTAALVGGIIAALILLLLLLIGGFFLWRRRNRRRASRRQLDFEFMDPAVAHWVGKSAGASSYRDSMMTLTNGFETFSAVQKPPPAMEEKRERGSRYLYYADTQMVTAR